MQLTTKKGILVYIYLLIQLYITVESFYTSEQLFTIKMSSLKEAKSRNVFSTSFHPQKNERNQCPSFFLCVFNHSLTFMKMGSNLSIHFEI